MRADEARRLDLFPQAIVALSFLGTVIGALLSTREIVCAVYSLEYAPLNFSPSGVMMVKNYEGAVAAPGASEIDGLGRHVVSQNSSQQQLTQAPVCATLVSSVDRKAEITSTRPVGRVPSAELAAEQRRADAADAQEFQQIQKFVGECRRYWPGAMIVLRPGRRG
jgi:hypothetical protein